MNQKDWLVIAIFTFLTVFAWIVSDVYHAVVTSQITEVQAQLIAPLNPRIDQIAIDNIRTRSK